MDVESSKTNLPDMDSAMRLQIDIAVVLVTLLVSKEGVSRLHEVVVGKRTFDIHQETTSSLLIWAFLVCFLRPALLTVSDFSFLGLFL